MDEPRKISLFQTIVETGDLRGPKLSFLQYADKAIRCCVVPKFFGVLRTRQGVVPNQAEAEVPVFCPVFLANVFKVAHLSRNNSGRNVNSVMLGLGTEIQ